jgi:cellulose synthase/poly-beta-1,6-N-acetylglucosamine synthase-like glycosyltransferase
MRVVLEGYRIIFESKARAFDAVSDTSKKEFTRKARTLAGNFQAFFQMKDLFNPFKNRVFFQLVSHKVFRLLVPYALIFALISNVFLNSPIYRTMIFLQIVFYACATIGFFLSKFKVANYEAQNKITSRFLQPKSFLFFCGRLVLRLFSTSYVFFLLNCAAVVGLYRFITHKQKVTWEKANGREVLSQNE